MNDTVLIKNGDQKTVGLSACAIKYIAVTAMLIDHIAWCFVDTYSVPGQIMHIIGRITAPVMTYFLAEGFYYTRNVNKYLLRLGIFAAASYVPFIFMEYGTLPITVTDGEIAINPLQGVIYTFFLTVLALKVRHSEKLNGFVKGVLITLLCIFSLIGDWFFFPIVWALFFDRYRGDLKKQMIWFAVTSVIMELIFLLIGMTLLESLFQLGVLLAVIPLYFYNGERGNILGKADKWFFYIFYPLHMAILGILKFYVFI